MRFFDWLLASQETRLSYRERERACRTCEVLSRELQSQKELVGHLLEHSLFKPESKPEPVNKVMGGDTFNRVPPTSIRTWESTRAVLEAKDAEEFARQQALKKQAEIDRLAKANSVKDLEKELGVEDAV